MIPPALRRPIALLGLALAGSLSLILAAWQWQRTAAAERERASADLTEIRARLVQLPKRIEHLRREGDPRPTLRAHGFIGLGDRLAWISALARVQAEIPLTQLAWQLEPARPGPLPGLTTTAMQLDLAPMDPQRLRTWLDALDRQRVGVYSVEHCDWTPAEQTPRMHCRLIWWTWQETGDRP